MARMIDAVANNQPGSRTYQVMTAVAHYAGLRLSDPRPSERTGLQSGSARLSTQRRASRHGGCHDSRKSDSSHNGGRRAPIQRLTNWLIRGANSWCPRRDSNARTRLRRPLLYPLSYEGGGWRKPGRKPPGDANVGAGGMLAESSVASIGSPPSRDVARSSVSAGDLYAEVTLGRDRWWSALSDRSRRRVLVVFGVRPRVR